MKITLMRRDQKGKPIEVELRISQIVTTGNREETEELILDLELAANSGLGRATRTLFPLRVWIAGIEDSLPILEQKG